MADQRQPGTSFEEEPAEASEGPQTPTDTRAADALIDEALQNPDLSPAVRAVLAPLRWYVEHLKHDLDMIAAPMRWVESLKVALDAQAQHDQAWSHTVQVAALRPFDVGHDSRVWVTSAPWAPDHHWVVIADAAVWGDEAGVRVWSNPRLRAVAREHPGGSTFVERFTTAAQLIHQLEQFQAPREEER